MGQAVKVSYGFIRKLEAAIGPRVTSMGKESRRVWLTVLVNVKEQWREGELDLIRLVKEGEDEDSVMESGDDDASRAPSVTQESGPSRTRCWARAG